MSQGKRENRILTGLLDIFFERLACPVCGSQGQGLCVVCQKDLRFWGDFSMEGCRGHAMYHYQGTAKNLLFGFKQQSSREAHKGLCLIMDRWLEDQGSRWLCEGQWDRIVPVSSIAAKVRLRGFDPAHRLAEHISQRTGIRTLDCIVNEGSREQKTMGYRQRHKASRAAFRIRPSLSDQCRGRRLLIFDDVMTSGTTVLAAAQRLRDAGAAEVGFLVVQRASI